MAPISGMIMSPTSASMILPNAAPMMTPTARSTTLPLSAKRLNFSRMESSVRAARHGRPGKKCKGKTARGVGHPGWRARAGVHVRVPMLQGWFVVLTALGYIGLLFVVASYGDRLRARGRGGWMRPLIYPLSLAIYCTSWTFFGSVGLASRTGYDFLTIYVGPILLIGLGWPLLLRVVRLAKAQNITSIADFIAARYGKNPAVAATVALIAIVGTVPYIALQLKAISASLGTILAHVEASTGVYQPAFGDVALFVALAMFGFAI